MAKVKSMCLANEVRAARIPAIASYSDRQLFVANLGTLLSQTREGIVGCYLDEAEFVHVVYRSGHEELVNIRCDSYMAIIKDVAKEL